MTLPRRWSSRLFSGKRAARVFIRTSASCAGILTEQGTKTTIVTPFSWGRALTVPVFGLRLALERCSAGR